VLIIYGDAAVSNGAVNSMGRLQGLQFHRRAGRAGIRTFVATSPATARGALADAAGAALQGAERRLLLLPVNVQLADMDLGKALPPPARSNLGLPRRRARRRSKRPPPWCGRAASR
jgi:hypothetical protein